MEGRDGWREVEGKGGPREDPMHRGRQHLGESGGSECIPSTRAFSLSISSEQNSWWSSFLPEQPDKFSWSSQYSAKHASPWFQPFCPGFYPLRYIDQAWSLFHRSTFQITTSRGVSPLLQDKSPLHMCFPERMVLATSSLSSYSLGWTHSSLWTFQWKCGPQTNRLFQAWSQLHLLICTELQMKFQADILHSWVTSQLPVSHKKGCC